MYCAKCGTKNDEKNNVCVECGNKLKKEEVKKDDSGINTLSIFALVLSFLLWPVGLILSIIGMAKSSKYKKENNKAAAYSVCNYVALAVSLLSMVITGVIFLIVVLAVGLVEEGDNKVLGEYTCYINSTMTYPVVSAEFKNHEFSWGKYNDTTNNVLKGKYTINKRETKNGVIDYEFILKPNYYTSTTKKVNTKDKYTINITRYSDTYNVIKFENSSTYYCRKIGR